MMYPTDEEEEPLGPGAFAKLGESFLPDTEISPLELRDLLGPEMPEDMDLGIGGGSLDPALSAPPSGMEAPPSSPMSAGVPLTEEGELADPHMIKQDLREILRQRSLERSARAEKFQTQTLSSNRGED